MLKLRYSGYIRCHMKTFLIKEVDLKQLLGYLGTKPHSEVEAAITFLRSLPELPTDE